MNKASKTPSIKPVGLPPTVPANSADVGKELGFDFVDFRAYVLYKSPKSNGKKWKLAGGNGKAAKAGGDDKGPASFTRKQFGGLGQKFWVRNSSAALVDQASPAANALQAKFDGQPKLLAACVAIGKGKLKDTKVLHGHLDVLADAQNKLAAEKTLVQASAALTKAEGELKAFNRQLLDVQKAQRAEARQRLDEMQQAREQVQAAKGKTRTKEQDHVAARARTMADSLVHKVTDAAPAIPAPKSKKSLAVGTKGKSKPSLLKTAKAAMLPRPTDSQTKKTQKEQKARIAELTASAHQRQPVGPVNREALHQEIHTRAKAAGVSDQEYVEYLLLDLPVGGYLPQDVFDALRELHAAKTAEGEARYAEIANAQLAQGQQRVAQLRSRYDDAKTAYDALPMPG